MNRFLAILAGCAGLALLSLAPEAAPAPKANPLAGATIQASASLPGYPAANAIDGSPAAWQSGEQAPGWLTLTLAHAVRLGNVSIWLSQDLPGDSRTMITAHTVGGQAVVLINKLQKTANGDRIGIDLPNGLPDVQSLWVEIDRSPSPVGLKEITLTRSDGSNPACLLTAENTVNLRADPSTGTPPVGQLLGTQSVLGTARVAAESGPDWFETSLGSFVRADVVTVSPACAGF